MDSFQKDLLARQIVNFMKDKGASSASVKFSNENCTVSVRRAHGLGDLISFASMKWLSELLNTEKINLDNEYHADGCDTCDWGSYDEADLVCYDINPIEQDEE